MANTNIIKLNYTADEINEKLGKVVDAVQTTGDSKTAVMSQKAVSDYCRYISELTSKGVSLVNTEWVAGGVHASGTFVEVANAIRTDYIPYLPIGDFVFSGNANATSSTALFLTEYDKDFNFIVRNSGYRSVTLSPTSNNCAYIVLGILDSEVEDIMTLVEKADIYYKTNLHLEKLNEDCAYPQTTMIPALKSTICGGDFPCEWENGGINSSGILVEDASCVRTKYIDFVNVGKLVFANIDVSQGSSTLYMAEYDKNHVFIKRTLAYYPNTLSPTSENCAYVVFAATNTKVAQADIPKLVSVHYEDNRQHIKMAYAFDGISVKSINHRGYNRIAPENTLPAFRLSKQKGFDFVECDINLTSDGVPVLLHDETINRTARNADGSNISQTINIADITYEQALAYDFGVWKNEIYAGTKIPTLDEFMTLCKNLGLFAYIELKSEAVYTDNDISNIVAIVKKYGMEKSVSYISFDKFILEKVSKVDKNARLGFIQNGTTDYGIKTFIYHCKTDTNSLFFDCSLSKVTTDVVDICEANKIPIEVYCPNTEEEILALDNRVTGITSDLLIAKDVLFNVNIGDKETGLL